MQNIFARSLSTKISGPGRTYLRSACAAPRTGRPRPSRPSPGSWWRSGSRPSASARPKLNLLGKMLHFGEIPKKIGEIWRKFSKVWPNLGKFAKFWKTTAKNLAIFNENFEIRKRCKGVQCVDLGESFPTHIYLQKSASIQPRTSSFNFD